MKRFRGYTCPAVSVAFGTSLTYVLAFMLLKAYQQNGWLIFINVFYAFFVFFTVVWDRLGRFRTIRNAKLVTLGTAVAPIATNIVDVLLTLLFTYPYAKWPHVIYFLVVAVVFLVFQLVLCFAIPVEIRKSKKRLRSSSGS